MKVVYFLCLKRLFQTEQKKMFALMCFVMKMIWLILFIHQINKSHYVYIKDFNRFMCNKTNNKNIKHFCRYFLHCFSRERVLIEHKKTCLEINGKQTVKLRNNLLGFKNHFKQLFHLKFTLILNLFWKELKVMIETKRLHILKNIKIIL